MAPGEGSGTVEPLLGGAGPFGGVDPVAASAPPSSGGLEGDEPSPEGAGASGGIGGVGAGSGSSWTGAVHTGFVLADSIIPSVDFWVHISCTLRRERFQRSNRYQERR